MSLSALDIQFFTDNGFIVLDELLKDEIKDADDLIKNLLSSTKLPTSRDDAKEFVVAKSKLQTKKILLDLVKNEKISKILTILLGSYENPTSCQIASRFPGENTNDENDEEKVALENNWHIDNYTKKDFNRRSSQSWWTPREFSCLVGVYLTDNETEFSGNFTVFPGSHHQIQAYSVENNGKDYYEKNGLDLIRRDLVVGKPYQVKAKKGTVVFAHRFLAHLISAPNNTNNIRTIVWFRVRGSNQSDESFVNIWRDYKGIEKDTLYPKIYEKEIIDIERKGLGYFVKNVPGGFVARIKQNGKNYFPCMFASYITLNYVEDEKHNKLISIHTNGFINKTKHKLIEDDLKQLKSLTEIAEWIYNCDYQTLIESWHPLKQVVSVEDVKIIKIIEKTIELHHLHSKSKSAMMQKWGKELCINGKIEKGTPGLIVLNGPEELVNVFLERFKCFHWKHFKIIDKLHVEDFVGFNLINQ